MSKYKINEWNEGINNGDVLNKETHDKLLSFNGETIIMCTKDHSATKHNLFDTSVITYSKGEKDKLKYVSFETTTYENWLIVEIRDVNSK